jgi:hypothetical protein
VILEILVRLAGLAQLLLLPLNAVLVWRFHLGSDIGLTSRLTQSVHRSHYLFTMAAVGAMGLLALVGAPLLIRRDPLSAAVDAGSAGLWMVRLIVQFAVYDRSLWKGERSKAIVHWASAALWTGLISVYVAAFATATR